MIATDHLVYIHLHKSGGTFINEALMRFMPGARQLGYHLPCRMIPPVLRALPVLGFVRNPWSYYVSWYTFQSSMAIGNAVFRSMSDDKSLGFAATIRNLLSLGQPGSPRLDALLEALPEAYGTKGLNLPRAALAPIRDSGLGFYAYLHQYMFSGHGGRIFLGKTEQMREDFLAFLARYGIPASDSLRDYILNEPARNRSEHRPYMEFYDEELREMVAERDASVIRSYGYRFGD